MNACDVCVCVCLLDYFSIDLTGGCFIIAVYLRMAGTVLRHEVRSHISFITLSISCNKLTLREVRKHSHKTCTDRVQCLLFWTSKIVLDVLYFNISPKIEVVHAINLSLSLYSPSPSSSSSHVLGVIEDPLLSHAVRKRNLYYHH